jgi:hypothetical protein
MCGHARCSNCYLLYEEGVGNRNRVIGNRVEDNPILVDRSWLVVQLCVPLWQVITVEWHVLWVFLSSILQAIGSTKRLMVGIYARKTKVCGFGQE